MISEVTNLVGHFPLVLALLELLVCLREDFDVLHMRINSQEGQSNFRNRKI